MQDKSKELEVAIQAALEAGKILTKYFETEILHEFKEDKSITTIADKEAEEKIKEIIFSNFPEHSILAEETGFTDKKSEYVWHIDPLDGTYNYANGIPIFAVSIALAHKDELIVGVIHNANMNLLCYAEKGKGTYYNETKVHVSSDEQMKSIVTISSSKIMPGKMLRRKLAHDMPGNSVASVRDFGCTALDLVFLAKGSTEGDIKFGLDLYDFAAGLVLVSESGGKITNIEGGELKLTDKSYIASNGLLHDVLVEEIKRQKQILNI